MKSVNIFRTILLASCLFGIAGAVLNLTTYDSLPPQLRDYVLSQHQHDAIRIDTFSYIFETLFSIAFISSLIGLWRFSHWAPPLYVFSYVASTIFILFKPPEVSTPLGNVFSSLSLLTSGAVIALIYFSPISKKFSKSIPNQALH